MTPQEFNKKVKDIKALTNDKRFKQSFGLFARKMMYARTKLGFGVSSDTAEASKVKRVKLSPLSDSYIKQRQGKLKFFTGKQGQVYAKENSSDFKIQKPKLGKLGKPSKSNLTYTGEMLEALSFKITKTGVELYIDNSSRTDDSGLNNNEVAEFASETRPFMNFTNDEHKRVVQFINDEIDRRLQKAFR